MKFSAYLSPEMPVNTLFAKAGLSDFDAWWNLQLPWLEPPNEERGGWSGVSQLHLGSVAGETQTFYVKRQQNHTRRTFKHPLSGVSTFSLEFSALQQLEAIGIAVPKVVFFAAKKQGDMQQAVLVTQALKNHVSLESLSPVLLTPTQQAQLAKLVGSTVRALHLAGWQHRAMYPKHLFVACHADGVMDAQSQQLTLIDLEKARPMWCQPFQQFTDLIPLFVRLQQQGDYAWSEDWLKSVYAHYCGQSDFSWFQRWAWSRIQHHLHQRRTLPN